MSPWAHPILSRDRNQWPIAPTLASSRSSGTGLAGRGTACPEGAEPLCRIGVEVSKHGFAVRTS